MEESNRYSNKFKKKQEIKEEESSKRVKVYKKPKYKNFIKDLDYV